MGKRKQLCICAALFCALALVCVLLDHICLKLIGDGERTLIPGVLGLRLIKNTGAAFGMLSSRAVFLDAVGFALIALMLALVIFAKMRFAARLSLTAALAGGACNLYMRVFRGGVNDWIELKLFDFPIFNFADVCVCVGAALFAVFYIFCGGKTHEA